MPHLKVKKFNAISLPAEYEGIKYNFIASNIQHQDERLISVSAKDIDDFFLVVKEQNNKVLLKSDKTTRPASIHTLHKALLGYAHLAELEVLSSNVPQNSHNPHLKEISALKNIEFFADSFPTDKEVCIEVGFGSGRHLLYQAKRNPQKLYIGLEIHRPSIQQVLKQINIQKLDNVMVLDYDARLFLEQVPSNIVGAIYVHFPVPWDKKPHRRIISKSFIAEAQRVLKVGGTLELRTDSENYYAYSYETFMSFTKIDIEIKKNKDIAITSKYEDRWRKMEKNIYDIIMRNDIDSPPLELQGDLSFEDRSFEPEELKNLHGKKIVTKECFVHFERIYVVDHNEDSSLIKISFGSFDRPEHLYLLLKDKKISYYPHMPLLSRANLEAHQEIKKVLYG